MLSKQTHTKQEETSEFKFTKARQTFSSKPPISVEGSWNLGLADLKVYHFFNIREGNNKFELYNFHDLKGGSILFEKSELTLEEIWKIKIIQPATDKMKDLVQYLLKNIEINIKRKEQR